MTKEIAGYLDINLDEYMRKELLDHAYDILDEELISKMENSVVNDFDDVDITLKFSIEYDEENGEVLGFDCLGAV